MFANDPLLHTSRGIVFSRSAISDEIANSIKDNFSTSHLYHALQTMYTIILEENVPPVPNSLITIYRIILQNNHEALVVPPYVSIDIRHISENNNRIVVCIQRRKHNITINFNHHEYPSVYNPLYTVIQLQRINPNSIQSQADNLYNELYNCLTNSQKESLRTVFNVTLTHYRTLYSILSRVFHDHYQPDKPALDFPVNTSESVIFFDMVYIDPVDEYDQPSLRFFMDNPIPFHFAIPPAAAAAAAAAPAAIHEGGNATMYRNGGRYKYKKHRTMRHRRKLHRRHKSHRRRKSNIRHVIH